MKKILLTAFTTLALTGCVSNVDQHGHLVEEDDLEEALSAQSRLKKRQAFMRGKSKRNMARGLKLRRASSPETLKKRAISAARRAVYKRILRGRDKSNLSAAEKSRIEQQVSQMKKAITGLGMRIEFSADASTLCGHTFCKHR